MRENSTEMVGGMTHGGQVVSDMVAGGMSEVEAVTTLSMMVDAQAMVLGTIEMFGVIGLLFFASATLIWFAPRPDGPIDMSAGH